MLPLMMCAEASEGRVQYFCQLRGERAGEGLGGGEVRVARVSSRRCKVAASGMLPSAALSKTILQPAHDTCTQERACSYSSSRHNPSNLRHHVPHRRHNNPQTLTRRVLRIELVRRTRLPPPPHGGEGHRTHFHTPRARCLRDRAHLAAPQGLVCLRACSGCL